MQRGRGGRETGREAGREGGMEGGMGRDAGREARAKPGDQLVYYIAGNFMKNVEEVSAILTSGSFKHIS